MSAARRLALSRLASLTAGSAAYIALISAIYNETGSALWVSAALFCGVVGSVVGAPAAGAPITEPTTPKNSAAETQSADPVSL